jgi:hypothetical protein
MKRAFLIGLVAVFGMAACQPKSAPPATPAATTAAQNAPTSVPATQPAPTAAPAATEESIYPVGPDSYPEDVDPLTGEVVDDPAVLARRPLLVKVSNESNAVRPQSGLSSADHVWEYQMEGWAQVRYTAVIYSQTPKQVGSVRSTRLIDVEHLMDMYGGLLATSGASTNYHAGGPPRINEMLRAAPWVNRVVDADFGFGDPWLVRINDVPRPGTAGWHTLFAIPREIWAWAAEKDLDQQPDLSGMLFDEALPADGMPTSEAVIDYPGAGPKHTWKWDEETGAWLSFTEFSDTTAEAAPDTDYLTGEQLAYENVVVLYAPHSEADYIEDEPNQLYGVRIDLSGEGEAVLLRDGQRYDVTWRRVGEEGMLHFFDAAGEPIAFKPGQTWFNVCADSIFPPDLAFTP